MRFKLIASMLLAAAVWPATKPLTATAQTPSNLRNPNIDIAYVEPRSAAFRPIYERGRRRGVGEEVRLFLPPLMLSERLLKKRDDCGPAPFFPSPATPAVICYEYIQKIEELAPEEK